MLNVTQEFKDALRSSSRKLYAKADIVYTDVFVTRNVTITQASNAYTSYPQQVNNGKEKISYKILSLDGSCTLDGSYKLAPTVDELNSIEMGYWSSNIADIYGNVSDTLEINFETSSVGSVIIAGDDKRGEYPVDFSITLLDENSQVLDSFSITNNDDIIFYYSLPVTVAGVAKVQLQITKWSTPNTNPKIAEFFTRLQKTYYNDDIVSINMLEEVKSEDSRLMISGVSTNQVQLSLYNRDNEFSAGNTSSPLYGALTPHRKINVYISYKDFESNPPQDGEFVNLGEFWTTEWNVPEDKLYVTVTAQDKLTLLDQSLYRTSVLKRNVSLYELAEDVLIDAGLKSDEYWIDSALQSYTIPYGYFKVMSHRQALQRIAQACLGFVYCGRDGKIYIKTIDTMFQGNSVATLTKSDYFKKINPVLHNEIINYVEVTMYPLVEETQIETLYDSSVPIPIEADETKIVTIEYNNIPSSVNITAKQAPVGFTITNIDYYSWGADVTVYSPNAGDFILKADGNPIKGMGKEIAIVKDDNSIAQNGVLKHLIKNCHLIQQRDHAEELANKALQISSISRRTFTVNWKGDPSLELGDKVSIQDDFETADFYIVRQEFQFNGVLRSSIKGRRAE